MRHLGPGRWLQVASAPPSHLHAPPRHTWRAGARAPPGRHFGNFIVRVLLNRNVLYTASAPRAAPAAPPQSTLATLPRSQHTTSARPTKLCMAWFIGDQVMAYYRAVFSLASQTAQRRQQRRVSSAATGSCGVCSHTKRPHGRVEAAGLCRRRTLIVAADDRRRPSFTHPTVPVCSAGRSGKARVWQASPSVARIFRFRIQTCVRWRTCSGPPGFRLLPR